MIPLKMLQMQGVRFSRNKAYLAYVAVTRKSKQRSRWGIFSGILYGNMEKDSYARPLLQNQLP